MVRLVLRVVAFSVFTGILSVSVAHSLAEVLAIALGLPAAILQALLGTVFCVLAGLNAEKLVMGRVDNSQHL